MYKIYKHTLLVGEHAGWSYIGQTSLDNPNIRWQNGYGYKKCTVFWRAIKKYGWENFSHEIIEDNIKTLEDANERETYWIKYYHTWIDDSQCKGYNSTLGGNNLMSEDVKEKISKSLMGHSVTDEMKKLYSDNLKAGIGCYKYWQGKKRSRETTEKILKTLKVRKVRCIETGEIYQSALYATRVVHGDVNRCVKGERKTAAGYHWEYVD